MAANTKDPILAIACQTRGVAGTVEGEMEVGVGLVALWHVCPNLLE